MVKEIEKATPANTIYIRTVNSKHLLSAFLNWFMGCLGRTTFTLHSISAQNSKVGIECTKATP